MSRLWKSSDCISVGERRKIERVLFPNSVLERGGIHPGDDTERLMKRRMEESEQLAAQMLKDAEAFAETRIRQAEEEINERREKASHEIEAWWLARRKEDEHEMARAQQAGYEEGFVKGFAEAEQKVLEQYHDMLSQARRLLEQAQERKRQIIAEADPFLIELSCGIAEKVIDRQLTIQPEFVVELVKSVLTRIKGEETISVAVNPDHYSLLQAARDELVLSLDRQAELLIVPDPSIADHGCVIRSRNGIVDARIDTQLKEIKRVLISLANEQETPDE